MEHQLIETNGQKILEVISTHIEINAVQDALDWLGTASYEGANCILFYEQNVNPDFFDLKTKLAGDILQKAVNYRMKVAIVGEFSKYDSKSLNAFIVECNRGRQIFFVGDRETAVSKLKNS